MAATLFHRGPDDAGVWADEKDGVALGHRRLSILDLSPEGRQPMRSASGRFSIVFNGEIYNFRELRAELDTQYPFRGSSDTEVILAAFETWGIYDSVTRFNGMFAIAVWDRLKRVLCLARDRAGEKPLYYAWMGSTFLFGSELKALRVHPAFSSKVSRGALSLFLRFGYVPTPYSIYEGVAKLPGGTILEVNPAKQPLESRPLNYWCAKDLVENCSLSGSKHALNDREAVDQLEALLSDSIRLRMRSDVPLGAFLSGGIDSSTVVALMQKYSTTPVKTFTIGFDNPAYNEAVDACKVARHLRTEHTELYVTPADALSVIPQLPTIYDEPFADSSQIPTLIVSKLARQHVTVSLSGDGADELFGGYTRYLWAERLWRRFGWMSTSSRHIVAGLLLGISPKLWEAGLGWLKLNKPADKIQKLAGILNVSTPEELYVGLVSNFEHPAELVTGGYEPATALTNKADWPNLPSFVHRMMYLDAITYLPDDILVKLDRASMAVSLEARVPFLDHRVIEFAWQLPSQMRIRDGQTKWLLRQVLDRYVPRALTDRPKQGFGVPLHEWLRGPLRSWAEQLLDIKRLHHEGFLNPEPIRLKWLEHLSGKHNWMPQLWNVLMFQSWLEGQAQSITVNPSNTPAACSALA